MQTIHLVKSRKTDSVETINHKFSQNKEEATSLMECLALEGLKEVKGMKPADELASPLNDTTKVEDIISGYTIRRSNENPSIIYLWKIERVANTIFPGTHRVQSIIRCFQVEEISSISK